MGKDIIIERAFFTSPIGFATFAKNALSMHFFSSQKRLGIVGGGQLGKMLLYTTQKWDISTAVLDPQADAAAAPYAHSFIQGDLMDFDAVYNFGKELDLLTFEIENINVEALKKLENEGVTIYPQPKVLEIIQDKTTQKEFYKKHQIPTAEFKVYESLEELKLAVLNGQRSFPFVWKAPKMGYDGFGVRIIRNNLELEDLTEGRCLVEEMIPYQTELSVVVCRNTDGMFRSYPVVEMEFHPTANQVEYVLCPARIPDKIASQAQALAKKVSETFGHVGLLAVEMFMTASGELYVNEVAPRPHNSGHYSIEAAVTDQFEQHIRAILNLPLGDTKSLAAAVMVNLVGDPDHEGPVFYQNMDHLLTLEGVTPHIYGKKHTRPFRKMGHVNVIHSNIKQARTQAEEIKKIVQVISK